MSGYTKRMMELSAEWLTANPDPESPFLTVPGLDKNISSKGPAVTAADRARYKQLARRVPEAAGYVEDLLRLAKERDAVRDDLHGAEDALEKRLSKAPTLGHSKHTVDDLYYADLGRWCLAWGRQGYNVFDLSPDFTAAIILTDARALDISNVQLPFAGMLFMISDGFAKGAEGTSYTKIHVTEVPRRDRDMLEVGEKIYDTLKDLSPTARSNVLHAVSSTSPAPTRDTSPSLIDRCSGLGQNTTIHIHATDGVRVLETWIDREGLTWDAFDDLPDAVTEDTDKQARHALRQIVFGAIAYINAVESGMERRFPEPKKANAKPNANTKRRANHWTIGRTIKIDPLLVQAVRLGSREVAFRLKHRHIVRGHYRNQAHGPERSLRTKKWISPHWKGPQEGAALVHTYKLDELKKDA